MIAKKDYELIKAIKNHKCCGKSDSSQGGGEGSAQSQSLLMSLIPSSFPKPAKFLVGTPGNVIDATDYTIDEAIQYADEQGPSLFTAAYESNELDSPIAQGIGIRCNDGIVFTVIIPSGNIAIKEVPFEGKTYYYYSEEHVG